MPRLRLTLLFLFGLCATLPAAEAPVAPQPEIAEIPFTVAASSFSPSLTRGGDGSIWLSWIETSATAHALRCAQFDAHDRHWREAHTIADAVNPADDHIPALTIGPDGRLTALWSSPLGQKRTGATLLYATSSDHGVTWSAPAPLSRESEFTSHGALVTIADGRVMAAWLDRRGRAQGETGTRLYARILTAAAAQDVLLEPLVSEGAAPALAAFPDSGAVLIYRGRSDGEIRDVHIIRYRDGSWENDHVLNHDDWRLTRGLSDGPQIAAAGGRLASAWFTAADSNPRVQLATSPDAGARFLMPLTLDHGHPVGHPAVALLHDGAAIGLWIEAQSSERNAQASGLWLRRVSPDFALDHATLLAPDAARPIRGQPRIALVDDFNGENKSATVLVAYATADSGGTVRTLLVKIPEYDLLAAANAECHCAPAPEQLLGYPIRGAITAVNVDRLELTAKHGELPGLLPGGAHVFRVTPELLKAVQPGREFLGRIEQRDGGWRLFDVRLLVSPPKKKS